MSKLSVDLVSLGAWANSSRDGFGSANLDGRRWHSRCGLSMTVPMSPAFVVFFVKDSPRHMAFGGTSGEQQLRQAAEATRCPFH